MPPSPACIIYTKITVATPRTWWVPYALDWVGCDVDSMAGNQVERTLSRKLVYLGANPSSATALLRFR